MLRILNIGIFVYNFEHKSLHHIYFLYFIYFIWEYGPTIWDDVINYGDGGIRKKIFIKQYCKVPFH